MAARCHAWRVHEILLVAVLACAAYTVKGITGAASAVVFNTGLLLALAFGLAGNFTLQDGLAWVALTDAATGLFMLVLLRREVKAEPLTLRMLAGLLPTCVLFTVVLSLSAPETLGMVLAIVLALCGLWLCLRRDAFGSMPIDRAKALAIPTGLLAGVIGGLFGMAGPITFLLMGPASRDPGEFRRRTVFLFALVNLVRVTQLASMGQYTNQRLLVAAWTLPVVICSTLGGMALHRHIKPSPFRIGLGVVVMVAGAVALWKLLQPVS